MKSLIKIENDKPTVLARRLYKFLEVKTEFRHWFPRMCEYGFEKGIDFNPVKNDRFQIEGDRRVMRSICDYQLTIDMAKEICMIQRTDRGKEARQYFLEVEKKWNDPEMVMGRALKIYDAQVKKLEAKAEEDRPKILFADSVSASPSTILVRELAKLLKQNGIDTGEKKLFKYLRENGYLIKRKGSDYNMPTQRSMELGIFEIKESTMNSADGNVILRRTPKVTGKGQFYFINKFKAGREPDEQTTEP